MYTVLYTVVPSRTFLVVDQEPSLVATHVAACKGKAERQSLGVGPLLGTSDYKLHFGCTFSSSGPMLDLIFRNCTFILHPAGSTMFAFAHSALQTCPRKIATQQSWSALGSFKAGPERQIVVEICRPKHGCPSGHCSPAESRLSLVHALRWDLGIQLGGVEKPTKTLHDTKTWLIWFLDFFMIYYFETYIEAYYNS